jgi:hypothetical protein
MIPRSAGFLHLTDVLAVHRITHLITEDTVPFGAVRELVQRRWPNSLAAEWFSCPWCASTAVAAGVVTARILAPRWWAPIATALSLSSITGLLATWENSK